MCFHPRSSWLLHKKSVNQTGTGLAPTPAAAPPPPTTTRIHTPVGRAGQGEGVTCSLAKGPTCRRRLLETCPTMTDRCRTSVVSWVTVMG